MSFLQKLRNQPRSVRTAVTWGVAIAVVAAVVPFWFASLETALAPQEEPTAVAQEGKASGAIGLFLGAAGNDIRDQFREATASLKNAFTLFDDGAPVVSSSPSSQQEHDQSDAVGNHGRLPSSR